jgi:hypothetical protein
MNDIPTTKYIRKNPNYLKEWYLTNKEKHLLNLLTPITCSCGITCGKINLKRHQKTKLHLKKLSKL